MIKKTKRDFSSNELLKIFNEKYNRNDEMRRLSTMEPGDNFRIFAKDYYYKEKVGNEVVAIEKKGLKEKKFSLLLEVVYEPGPKTKIKKTKKKVAKKIKKKVVKKKIAKKKAKKTTRKDVAKKKVTKKKDGKK